MTHHRYVYNLVHVNCFSVSPAQASFRVIKWSVTNICQIYDFGWGPPDPLRLSRADGAVAELRRRLRANTAYGIGGSVRFEAGGRLSG